MPDDFRYAAGERLPGEVLVFEIDPEHVDEFLVVDHEVWTLVPRGIGLRHPSRQSVRAGRALTIGAERDVRERDTLPPIRPGACRRPPWR